ncbi:rhodanese-like domain-containing protein [Weissella viridescens]|uniref:Rhodanese-like domain-containing protein n=1 Tax=Weissella viridescens TaxID=1629 RepID=A0A3P2RGM9_WEIVI|nr:rhodanese-like domain-containing protein [Weissella viridescens]RRG18715.1 rhodanese-like domain-containing protein [Weissella viridescens]
MNLIWTVLLTILIIWVAWTAGMWLWTRYGAKSSAKVLDSKDFDEQSRGHQIFDLRDADSFKAKHVLGARNVPYAMLKDNHAAIRKDQPVFLYDTNMQYASRLARILKKEGYHNIYILKNGFATYHGRTKSNNVN